MIWFLFAFFSILNHNIYYIDSLHMQVDNTHCPTSIAHVSYSLYILNMLGMQFLLKKPLHILRFYWSNGKSEVIKSIWNKQVTPSSSFWKGIMVYFMEGGKGYYLESKYFNSTKQACFLHLRWYDVLANYRIFVPLT
jgi:hypothetical protein